MTKYGLFFATKGVTFHWSLFTEWLDLFIYFLNWICSLFSNKLSFSGSSSCSILYFLSLSTLLLHRNGMKITKIIISSRNTQRNCLLTEIGPFSAFVIWQVSGWLETEISNHFMISEHNVFTRYLLLTTLLHLEVVSMRRRLKIFK